MKRQRGRGRRSGGGNNNPNKHFESNGPDVKIRGSAQQILDKYLQYARDAQSSGDRVNAENYLQHAEHYYRLLAAMQPKDKPRDQNQNQDQKSGEQKAADGETNADANADGQSEAEGQSGKSQRNGAERGERGRRGRRSNKRDQADQDAVAETDTDAGKAAADVVETAEPAEASAKTDTDPVDAAAEEATPKPKPRRRAVRKPKVAETEGEEPTEGIMKTLSRGRKPKAQPVADDANPPASEVAE